MNERHGASSSAESAARAAGPSPKSPVPAAIYDERYFLHACEGSDLYAISYGNVLPERLSYSLSLAEITPGKRVLDLGCGRGELAAACSAVGARVVAVDYSEAAVKLTVRTLERVSPIGDAHSPAVLRADVTRLPLEDTSIDLVYALDIIEHLTAEQLESCLSEIYRILRPGGKLVVHTMPNTWYYACGYPIYRLAQRLRGRVLPANPRHRWEYVTCVHVNEQNPRNLARSLSAPGFDFKTWVASVTGAPGEGPRLRALRRLLTHLYPLNLVLCNDIFAVATKRHTISR